LYWETDKIKKERYTEKVVGEDIDKRILESKPDALLLITHPIQEKNREIIDKFEKFA
jgi:hypothetical protein